MDSEPTTPFRPRSARLVAAATLPEVEFYFHLLVLIHLIDTECYNEVSQGYSNQMITSNVMLYISFDSPY